MKDNIVKNKFYWAYLTGFYIILVLPLIALPHLFSPPNWGKTIIFRSIFSILLFLFVYQLLHKKARINLLEIKNNKVIYILLAIFLFYFLATIFSTDIGFSLWGSPYRGGGFVNFTFYILFAISSFFIIKDYDWNKLWNCSIFTGVLVSLFAIVQYFGLFNKTLVAYESRPPSTVGNPIILGIYLILLIFITLSFAIKETKLSKKIFYWCIVLLFLYVILITGSRSAYLGLLIGGIFFALFYPKKLPFLKISVIITLFLIIFTVYYVNNTTEFPQFLQNSKIFQSISSRLSIEAFLKDPRFSAWQISFLALKEKPILGWGPENFSIGFDKYYDPSFPYISAKLENWWDRAHNFLLDIGVTTGIPSLIIYLSLFGILLWQLQKIGRSKKIEEVNANRTLMAHGIQATLIAYFVANFFFFDAFPTYLIFFLLVGYSMHIIYYNAQDETQIYTETRRTDHKTAQKKNSWKPVSIFVLFSVLVLFLWQYNILPLQVNAQINKSIDLAENKNCEKAFLIMDVLLLKHSFLDSYVRSYYINEIKKCADYYPEKNLEYAKKGVDVLQEAVKIRPLYSRFWMFLGSFTTVKANAEEDTSTKENLIKEANLYFEKALKLAPNHHEILVEQAKTNIVTKNYLEMKKISKECISKEESLGECYWMKALSEIYLRDLNSAVIDINLASEKGFGTTSVLSLHQLVSAYAAIEQYNELAAAYEKLIILRPDVAQYHSSLAFTYLKLKQYDKARTEALKFLELMPEAKEEVNAFLKMLP